MVLSDEERKANRRKYDAKPDVKKRRKEYLENPKNKIKRLKQRKEYNQRSDVKKREKRRRDLPKNKAKLKAKRDLPKNKIKAKKIAEQWREKNKDHIAKYQKKNKGKKAKYQKEWNSDPKNKARIKKLNSSPKYVAKQKEHRINLQMTVFLKYSKRHSKSDVPCCRCCGQTCVQFLAVDHIAGKKQMDSEPELVKLGYSSKFYSDGLKRWIIKNNFPKGFQILCHNCNLAKGFSKDNKCPLKNKPHW
jgi:hypothetical protein